MSRLRRIARMMAAAAALLVLGAAGAEACSVCIGTQSEDTTIAYRAMTAFMTFTPLAIVGGVIYWIHRRFKALDADETARRGDFDRGPASGDYVR